MINYSIFTSVGILKVRCFQFRPGEKEKVLLSSDCNNKLYLILIDYIFKY